MSHYDQPIAKPYTPAQRRLFNAAAHDPEIRRRKGISRDDASDLADEANRLAREGKEKKKKAKSFIDLTPVFYPDR